MALTKTQNRPFAGSGIKPVGNYTRQIRIARPGKARDYIASRLPARGRPQR